MKLVALCGLHGSGKDTVAYALPARKLAFADVLYREVAQAFDFTVPDLKCRETKEIALRALRLTRCNDNGFLEFNGNEDWESPHSPRQILQWWGDYRRSQDADYFARITEQHVRNGLGDCVITDCRFPNEADMVRKLGGKIWQVIRTDHNPHCTDHPSETTGSEFSPDVVIYNDGTLEQLKEKALSAWNK